MTDRKRGDEETASNGVERHLHHALPPIPLPGVLLIAGYKNESVAREHAPQESKATEQKKKASKQGKPLFIIPSEG